MFIKTGARAVHLCHGNNGKDFRPQVSNHAMTYPEFCWVDQYTHWAHEDTATVGTEQRNVQIFFKVPPETLKMHFLTACS